MRQNSTEMAQDFENLPIDIHYNKLLDWLINRRHCKQEWATTAMVIREKINAAIEDMPAVDEISSIIEGTNINYFHCLQIVELLKTDSESSKKNIFGQYSSQKMKNWQEIIHIYEKEGIYLADTAQLIARNVNYEIPALKKQIAKCQQTQKDCTRKEADYASSAADLRKKYEASCRQMGIQGQKIKSEFAALVRDLPSEFSKIAKMSKDLEQAVQYYKKFVCYIMNREDLGHDAIPVLTFVQKHGNVTAYQFLYNKVPFRIEENSFFIDTADEEDKVENPDNIDWDAAEETIDFGDVDLSNITVEGGGAEVEGAIDDIDWGESETKGTTDKNGSPEAEGDGIARGKDALSILENPDVRCLFLDDLMELTAFLRQRLVELQDPDSGGDSLQGEPVEIQLTTNQVEFMLSLVSDIIVCLTSVRMQHLLLIQDSPRYVDRLRDSLKQQLALADKMVFYEKEMVSKRNEALEEQRQLEPKLRLLISKTKEMQKQMEEEISKKYKGRRVNIMGEINTL